MTDTDSYFTDSYFQEPMATRLEDARAEKRVKGHLTFDCFNAKIKGDRVTCSKGYSLQGHTFQKGAPLLGVMAGRRTRMYRRCPDFVGDPDVPNP